MSKLLDKLKKVWYNIWGCLKNFIRLVVAACPAVAAPWWGYDSLLLLLRPHSVFPCGCCCCFKCSADPLALLLLFWCVVCVRQAARADGSDVGSTGKLLEQNTWQIFSTFGMWKTLWKTLWAFKMIKIYFYDIILIP